MMVLLGTAITASFLDSINPSAIAQQLMLQAMVRKKRWILFFILGIGLTNYLLGLAVYFGISAVLMSLWDRIVSAYPFPVRGTESVLGLVCFIIGMKMIFQTRSAGTADGQDETAKPARQLTPLSLFLLGAVFCAVELTSALPYFGFLTVLAGYQLGIFPVLCFILLYCLIYISPLVLLYIGYHRLQGTSAVKRLEHILSRVSAYIIPVVITIAGLAVMFDGGRSLLALL